MPAGRAALDAPAVAAGTATAARRAGVTRVIYLGGLGTGKNLSPHLASRQEVRPANVALIARHGADWFRSLGTPSHPGSALVTLSGPLAHPGVYEIENGATLSSLIEAASTVLFRVMGLIVRVAPLGVLGAVAYTVGKYGVGAVS